MRSIFLFMLCYVSVFSNEMYAQHTTEEVKAAIDQLFEGMHKSDSALASAVFAQGIIMQTIKKDADGYAQVEEGSTEEFLNSIAETKPGTLNEKILSYKINIDGNLASVWTPYNFYVGEKFSHCGVNSFQLAKKPEGWQIFHIVDTRHRQNCN